MFNTSDQALAFAFRMRHSHVVSLPSAAYMAHNSSSQHSGEQLTRYDLHAQAGMIFSWLSRRLDDEQLYAFFLHGTIKERRLAASLFVRGNRALFSKYRLNNTQLRNAVLARSVREVSEASGLKQYKAWQFRRELAELFEPIQERLFTAMQDELIDRQTPQ